ncbi:MAG: c-type cytochrome biogenesis protein CcmI [Casimicrobium sp.]
MNPSLVFIALVVVITALVTWVVLRPLLKRRVDVSAASVDTNVQAIRVELSEARRDRKLGLLSDAGLVEAERELEARVLSESAQNSAAMTATAPRYKRTAVALGVLLPVLAVVGYAAVGMPVAIVPETVRPPQAASAQDQQMTELFKLAEERLNKAPNDVKGWILLARAKASVGMFDAAMHDYEKAVALTPNDSELWSDLADAAAGQSQGKMDGKPLEYINKALALDGKNAKALLLRGTYEMQKNDLIAAEKSFSLAKSQVEPTSGFAQIADNALAEIKTRQGGAPSIAAANGDTSAIAEPRTSSDAVLATVKFQLSAEARKAANANPGSATVFLIVRAAGVDRGPPLAAKKISLAQIDQPIMLTAADAMIGGAGLKAGAEVSLQARLSLSGQPAAQPGDWQSGRSTLKLPFAVVSLLIDQVN